MNPGIDADFSPEKRTCLLEHIRRRAVIIEFSENGSLFATSNEGVRDSSMGGETRTFRQISEQKPVSVNVRGLKR